MPIIIGKNKSNLYTPSWDYFKNLASIVCSRESTYRTALDFTAFDLPIVTADLFRGPKKLVESIVEGTFTTCAIVIAPILTGIVGKILGRVMLSKNMKKDALHYLRFNLNDIRDEGSIEEKLLRFKANIEVISTDEAQDKLFIASLFERSNNHKRANKYKNQAEEITNFCNRTCNVDKDSVEEKRDSIYRFKKATIVGESLLEGAFWGSFGFLIRAFRKHVLKEDRFTGTMSYASDTDSDALGESGDLTVFQKIAGAALMFISPVTNIFLLNKLENKDAVEKSRFLQIVKNQYDLTHGLYPKLGLLFSMTSVPKQLSGVVLSQGWYERGERILKVISVLPSWWLGHRVTNGLFAKNADRELSKKYKTSGGILVEPEYLEPVSKKDSFLDKLLKRFPEPAKIQHVLKSTEHSKKLQEEAEDLHAKCLYKGFALHSALVWVINMVVNYITKLRVTRALNG